MNKSFHKAKIFLIDFGAILALCIAFVFIKGLYFSWPIQGWLSFWNGVWMIGVWVALTCYPAFLIGRRILKSPMWFFILSWLSVAIFFWLSLYLSSVLTFGVRGGEVFHAGKITSFGVLYELLNPRTFMAIWASWLLYRSIGHRRSGNEKE